MNAISFATMVGAVLAAVLIIVIVGNTTVPYYKEKAVENGCAGYDTVTGEWHWIDRSKIDD